MSREFQVSLGYTVTLPKGKQINKSMRPSLSLVLEAGAHCSYAAEVLGNFHFFAYATKAVVTTGISSYG